MKKRYSYVALATILAVFGLLNSASAQESVSVEKSLRQELSVREIPGKAHEVLIRGARVADVSSTTLKVSVLGYSYNIDASNAKLVRYYWGGSQFDEFGIGDVVNVFGNLDASDPYLVHAETVRNASIELKHGVFRGVVTFVSSSTNSFVMETEDRGSQTVFVSPETKFLFGNIICITTSCPAMGKGSLADLQVGARVLVRGVWNRTASRISASTVLVNIPHLKVKDVEKLEKKIEKKDAVVEKLEDRGLSAADSVRKKIDELQKRLSELTNKLRQNQIKLSAQNGSGQEGTAVLMADGAKTKVVVKLSNAPDDVLQPAHIHLGSCASIGAVKYPLKSLEDGKSETTLEIQVDTLVAGLPLALNVHKSVAESSVYVACGDLVKF